MSSGEKGYDYSATHRTLEILGIFALAVIVSLMAYEVYEGLKAFYEHSWWVVPSTIVLAYLVSDFVSGFVHFLGDTFGSEKTHELAGARDPPYLPVLCVAAAGLRAPRPGAGRPSPRAGHVRRTRADRPRPRDPGPVQRLAQRLARGSCQRRRDRPAGPSVPRRLPVPTARAVRAPARGLACHGGRCLDCHGFTSGFE